MNGQHSNRKLSITEEYEHKALAAFRAWYQQERPTIAEAAGHAYTIARDTVGSSLTADRVIQLLHEHEQWIYERPRERYDSDATGLITIGDIARRHFVRYLEQTIQRRGFQVLQG